MPHLNMDQRNQEIGMLSAGASQCHVASVMNCNQSTLSDLWNRYQQLGHARGRPLSGLPHMTTAHQDRYMRHCVVELNQLGGGGLMVWAGISQNFKTDLHIVRGRLNAMTYRDTILQSIILLS